METARAIDHDHVEGRGGRALLDETAHVKAIGVGPIVQDFMNRARVAMKRENHALPLGEETYKAFFVDTVRMKLRLPQTHQIDHIDDSQSHPWQMLAQ